MLGINQLIGHRFGMRQNTQPAKRIDFLKLFHARHRFAPDTMEPVARRNVIAGHLDHIAVFKVSNTRLIALNTLQANVFCLKNNLAAMGKTCGNKVLGDFGLAIDHHGCPTGQFFDVHMGALAVQADVDAAVDDAFFFHPRINANPFHQANRPHFQNTRTNAAFDIVAAFAFKDHRRNALHMQQMRQQQPGRAGPDNDDRNMHGDFLTRLLFFCSCLNGTRTILLRKYYACWPTGRMDKPG